MTVARKYLHCFCEIIFAVILCSAYPAWSQEIFIQDGTTNQKDTRDKSSAYSIGYGEDFEKYLMWSITYLNEGHVSNHKRDGLSPQVWGKFSVLNQRLRFSAGIGPYLYYDTHIHEEKRFHNHHGVGTMTSGAVTVFLYDRFFLQARGNWSATAHNGSTLSILGGIGYRLDVSRTGPAVAVIEATRPPERNELAILGGITVFNSISDRDSAAASAEYRRRLNRYFDLTVGWLYEGSPISRNGPATQIWARRSFFDETMELGIGVGPYMSFENGFRRDIQLSYLVSCTGGVRVYSNWAIRGTWHRVGTPHSDRDTDVFLMGIGYRF
ncbi:MAG TPA: hypothetical protein VHO84_05460 [Syntrophorhabdaceae bacterium]|nr:hypothetical protein [Syntrophorhabdaceae bacterium]